MDSSITERETGLIVDMVGNGLLVGSVIMCKLTPFVIMKDSDIEYMGGGLLCWWWVFWVPQSAGQGTSHGKGQGLITSVYRALTGSRHKTRRRQVTRIPSTPVTTELCTPTTQNKPPSGKTLEEGTTQDEFGGKWQVSLEEVPDEELIPNSNLGE